MEQETAMKLELQKRGAFLLTLTTGQIIKGRFSMNALDRFCEEQKIDSYLQLMEKITIGMKLRDYADLIVFALQESYLHDITQCPFTRKEVFEIIDDMGGINTTMFVDLVKHACGRIVAVQSVVTPEPEEEEKKSPSADMNTEESAPPQV